MKNKTNYELVARISGKHLTITPSLRDDIAQTYDQAIASLRRLAKSEERTLRIAMELERKGDFLAECAANVAAIRSYMEASEILRVTGKHTQYMSLLNDKVERLAAGDDQLKAMLRGVR